MPISDCNSGMVVDDASFSALTWLVCIHLALDIITEMTCVE